MKILTHSLLRTCLSFFILSLAVAAASTTARSQTAAIYGQLSNFDVVNHTGHDGHGFEVELEGIQPNDVYYSFSGERYGPAHIDQTATGIRVRWESQAAGGQFLQTTVPYSGSGTFGGSCYMGSANYDQAGCEHFGVSLTAMPTATHYRWLIENSAAPGTLIASDPPVAIPAPTYIITPPPITGEAPVLEAQIEAPEPAESPELYGDAQWVKVFKTELTRQVTLDELLTGNPIVPNDPSQIETEWELIQQEPASTADGGNRKRKRNQSGIGFDTRSVVRRYEIYSYTGAYDPLTHQALCADVACLAPSADEVGDYIGAQMSAANVTAQSLSVTRLGNGSVNSADRLIKCGALCQAGYNRSAQVALTASPSSGNVFVGWGGACTGSTLTCVVGIQDATNVTATFLQQFSLSVSTSGKGQVAGSAGISCGKSCSAKVVQGQSLTFTATPDPGFRFSNWSGACSGTSTACTVGAANGNTNVQAVFVKQ